MKSLLKVVFLFGLMFFLHAGANAQGVMKQRVERYLFSSYDMTKAGLREKDRLIQMTSDKLDEYILLLSKEEISLFKSKEKEFNQFLDRMAAVKDEKIMQQMIEDSNRSHKTLLANVLKSGISSIDEAQECRKIMVFMMMEKELLERKNKKLVVLLKDDFSRTKFVDTILESGKVTEQSDTKSLMVTVDLSLTAYDI